MTLNLCWLRSDLRAQDNTALARAMAAGPTMAVYVATPEQWQRHDDAAVKLDFWRRNLQALQEQLAALNVPLLFYQVPLYRDISPLFEIIITRLGVRALYLNSEYPCNEMQRDRDMEILAR